MRLVRFIPEVEAKASVMAWAEAKGISAREEQGWIIMKMSGGDSDPILEVMMDVLKGDSKALIDDSGSSGT